MECLQQNAQRVTYNYTKEVYKAEIKVNLGRVRNYTSGANNNIPLASFFQNLNGANSFRVWLAILLRINYFNRS